MSKENISKIIIIIGILVLSSFLRTSNTVNANEVNSSIDDAKNIIEEWSPVFYQQLNEDDDDGTPGTYIYQEDFFAPFNYDGDWRASNNWNNFPYNLNNLKGTIYYSFVETRTNYFLLYCAYHPRDWVDRSGDEHENDMEGALIVLTKNTDIEFGEFLYMQTISHNRLISYHNSFSSPSNDVSGAIPGVQFANGHPIVYVQAQAHSMYGNVDGDRVDSDVDFDFTKPYIEYYYGEEGEIPNLEGDDDSSVSQRVAYQLISFQELWDRRNAFETFNPFGQFDGNDDDNENNNADDCGNGSKQTCLGAAKAPWSWDQDSLYAGQIWYEPAELGNTLLDFDEESSPFDVPLNCTDEGYTRDIIDMCDGITKQSTSSSGRYPVNFLNLNEVLLIMIILSKGLKRRRNFKNGKNNI